MKKHVSQIVEELIPEKSHRNGDIIIKQNIIDTLSKQELSKIEDILLKMLQTQEDDLLIIETLVYMKSKKITSFLKEKLNKPISDRLKIIFISFLFKLGFGSPSLSNDAYLSFKKIKNKFSLVFLFYYLVFINSKQIYERIKNYTEDKDVLLSHNSKQALKSVSGGAKGNAPSWR